MNKTHLDNQIEIAKYNYNYFFYKNNEMILNGFWNHFLFKKLLI